MLPPETQRNLQRIQDNATRMGELIDGLLNFSTLTFVPVTKKKVDTKSVAQASLDGLRSEFKDRPIQIKLDHLPACQADPTLLRQLFDQLLSNALKFSRNKKPAIIEVSSETQDGQIVYFVKDNGVGFDLRYAQKLFGIFQRLHNPDHFEGLGVGLAIAQRIVQRHDGRIWAETEPDQGATFYFTLAKTPEPKRSE